MRYRIVLCLSRVPEPLPQRAPQPMAGPVLCLPCAYYQHGQCEGESVWRDARWPCRCWECHPQRWATRP